MSLAFYARLEMLIGNLEIGYNSGLEIDT